MRAPLFSPGRLREQLGCRIQAEDRFLRRKINQWFRVIRAHCLNVLPKSPRMARALSFGPQSPVPLCTQFILNLNIWQFPNTYALGSAWRALLHGEKKLAAKPIQLQGQPGVVDLIRAISIAEQQRTLCLALGMQRVSASAPTTVPP